MSWRTMTATTVVGNAGALVDVPESPRFGRSIGAMVRTFQVTFDAHDPARLAGFWAEALGYVLQPPPPGFASWEEFADSIDMPAEDRDGISAVVDPDGVGPRLLFLRVPEGKTAKNRVHLDVNVAGPTEDLEERRTALRAEADRLAGLGATPVGEREEHGGVWIVMQDPEGNEFCVQ